MGAMERDWEGWIRGFREASGVVEVDWASWGRGDGDG